MTPPIHHPVMADRVVNLLAPALERPGAIVADLTLGLGGHAAALLARCPEARLLGVDRDRQALAVAAERLAPFAGRTEFAEAVFDELPALLAERGLATVDAILLDLGLSSLQIDDKRRGFAYAEDAPLDMRMTPDADGPTAADIVNTWSKADLAQLFRTASDERFAGRIAAAIVVARADAPFTTSARLVETIAGAIPAAARHTGGHPAKRTFQALRVAVNGELDALAHVLPAALAALPVGGRLAVLAYHSGEDRLVKQALAAAARDQVPAGLPEVPDHLRAQFRLLTAGAERPCPDELAGNPRAASARLRAAERIKEAA
jgi:16S rRNA (cytosine1402-N4)-methyltransferase